MRRLLVHVEGETEIRFIENILRPYLCSRGYSRVDARKVGDGSDNSRRGGNRKWQGVKSGILRHLKQDASVFVTTMIDLFRLPEDYPNRHSSDVPDAIERGMEAEIGYEGRFLAFVMMHETDALLFCDCEALPLVMGQPKLKDALLKIVDVHGSPEKINTSPQKAPSKQIEREASGHYKKVLYGVPALELIGIESMIAQCPHFAEWVRKLEARGQM